ncbi:DUF6969 family protein [Cucumibacter marinus]|uniref:DUF6969 family protein n=1 Tax=Cucumibacter marinus TaxID=1121252 RepID=UPI0003FAE572|nr:hypothetical protein [Cucumibacter marinus]
MGDIERAKAEIAYCEAILAKSGLNVVGETLRDADAVTVWEHYPAGDVFDPETGAQWYYHSHETGEEGAEHGHFHCFLRPKGQDGPIHHLIAIGVDDRGRPLRLFTVNQWVVDDDWLDAAGTIALLDRFDVSLARPSFLVNRWLTAHFTAYTAEMAALVRERDARLASHKPVGGVDSRSDRSLEVTSEMVLPTLAG